MKTKQININRAIRRAAKSRNNTPIEVIPSSDQAPRLIGRSWHYVTPNGSPCPYPSAYRSHFGRPIYIASTVRVTVGELYIAAMGHVSQAESLTMAVAA